MLRFAGVEGFHVMGGSPVRRISARAEVSGKTRIRPRRRCLRMAMFNGIEVDVVDMPLQVIRVANEVFPVASLP